MGKESHQEGICRRLREERARLALTQTEAALLCGAGRRTYLNWEAETPIPSDRLAMLGEHGFDTQYILTGVRAGQRPDFEGKTQLLRQVTDQLLEAAEIVEAKIDTMQLGPIRDFAFRTQLTREDLVELLRLIVATRNPGYWADDLMPDVSGEMKPAWDGKTLVDRALLSDVIQAVDEVIAKTRLKRSPLERATIIGRVYDLYAVEGEEAVKPARVLQLIKTGT